MADTGAAPWTVHTLMDALKGTDLVDDDELEVELLDEGAPILRVVMLEHGHLPIYVSVEGEQILASTLLWPVAEQPDPAAFNAFVLRTHKLLPLSTFGIATVGGTDYYELFGALSARCALGDVVTELRMLATNAIDAAELRAA